jgi:glycosyltransferase involved in cell wall biosynthesis
MKLVLYSHDWAPKIGGVQTVTMLLAEGLAKRPPEKWGGELETIEVTLVTPTAPGEMDDAGFLFRVVRAPGLFRLMRLVRESDIVHLAGPSIAPLMLGLLFRKRVVVEHHGFFTICPNGLLFYTRTQSLCVGHFMAGHHAECIACNRREGSAKSVIQWGLTFLRRWLCKHVSANITPTHFLAEQLQLPRMAISYHGVPMKTDGTLEAITSSVVTFAFLGRLVPSKGLPLLLRAAAELKLSGYPFQLVIVGDGPERKHLESMTNELHLETQVCFVGFVPDDQLEGVLAPVTAIVVPSSIGEVFGLATAENMQRGRIAIVPKGTAISEVAGNSGLTFPEGDLAGVVEAMKRIIADSDLRSRLSAAARERCQAVFGAEAMVTSHVAIYKSLSL